jgi:hypothetical protein
MTSAETTEETEDEKALDYERYVAAREVANALSLDQSKIIDQTILAFGGGGLGITLTFLHNFVTIPVAPILLYLGDGLLLLSIITVLISLYASQKSIGEHISQLDNAARNDFGPAHTKFMKAPYINPWAKHTALLNKIAMGSVTIGMLLVALFVFQNFTGKETAPMKKDSNTNTTRPSAGHIERGAVLNAPAVAPKPAPAQQNPSTQQTSNK